MRKSRTLLRSAALVAALTLAVSLVAPLGTSKAEAGNTYIPFMATGNGFECFIFVINFFASPVRITIDTAVATRRTNTRTTFDLVGFEGTQVACAGLTGGGTGLQFLSVFLSQAASLPPQAFGYMFLPSELGGGVLVPPLLFQFT